MEITLQEELSLNPQAPRSPGFMRLLSYVVSNARHAELSAVENYAQMVQLFDTVDAKVEAVKQARDEAKHIVLLEQLSRRLGFPIQDSMVQQGWIKIRAHFQEAVRRGDLAACLIIQDLMVESLAIALYGTFSSSFNGDVETSRISSNLLRDELAHLDIGIQRIQGLLAKDKAGVHDSLVWAHHRVMPVLFEMVHNSCDFLCARHDLVCATVDMGSVNIDLEMLKIAALEHFVSMLDRVGFDPHVTTPLIASMAGYESSEIPLAEPAPLAPAAPACAPSSCGC